MHTYAPGDWVFNRNRAGSASRSIPARRPAMNPRQKIILFIIGVTLAFSFEAKANLWYQIQKYDSAPAPQMQFSNPADTRVPAEVVSSLYCPRKRFSEVASRDKECLNPILVRNLSKYGCYWNDVEDDIDGSGFNSEVYPACKAVCPAAATELTEFQEKYDGKVSTSPEFSAKRNDLNRAIVNKLVECAKNTVASVEAHFCKLVNPPKNACDPFTMDWRAKDGYQCSYPPLDQYEVKASTTDCIAGFKKKWVIGGSPMDGTLSRFYCEADSPIEPDEDTCPTSYPLEVQVSGSTRHDGRICCGSVVERVRVEGAMPFAPFAPQVDPGIFLKTD